MNELRTVGLHFSKFRILEKIMQPFNQLRDSLKKFISSTVIFLDIFFQIHGPPGF